MSKYLAFSLIIISLILGIGIGYSLTPSYKLEDTMNMGLGEYDNTFDLRYLNAMIAHHKGAMDLAAQAKEISKRNEIVNLANEILQNEPSAIDKLNVYRQEFYNDNSSVDVGATYNLGTYDDTFDLRYLNAMIAHHDDGINMANEALTKSIRNEVLDDANSVRLFLIESKNSLENLRLTWYGV